MGKLMKFRGIGGVGLAILFGLLSGQAHAEQVPCTGKGQIARGYTLEQRWEASVDCAQRRSLRGGLQDLGEDFTNGTNGAPKDWRRAVEAYELLIETSKTSLIQTFGARRRETAFSALINNFSKGNPTNGWPKDLARARRYAEQKLRFSEQPSAPEFADLRANIIQGCRQKIAEIDRAILDEKNRHLSAGETFRDPFATGSGVGPEMVVIKPGSFIKGVGKMGDFSINGPAHRVNIGYHFAVGRYEVSLAEWNACVADGQCQAGAARGLEERPVYGVSWNDAQSYVSWLNEKTGRAGRADRYRLLTESEWEYAARAGSTTPLFFGDNAEHLKDYAWYDDFSWVNNGPMYRLYLPEPVGTKRPNPFGLYDIYGNVAEWVEDCSNDRYYDNSPRDGKAFTGGLCNYRVLRGGSFEDPYMTSYGRNFERPGVRQTPYGFRVARTIPD